MQIQDAKSSQNLIELPQTFQFWKILDHLPPIQSFAPLSQHVLFYSNLRIKSILSNYFDIIIIIIIITIVRVVNTWTYD